MTGHEVTCVEALDRELERHDRAEPECVLDVPGMPGVQIMGYRGSSEDGVILEYTGWVTDLARSGLVPKAWLRPTGKHLRDSDGSQVSVVRYWRKQNGKPKRYCRILWRKPEALALALPGAVQAMAAYAAYAEWAATRLELVKGYRVLRERAPPKPSLRLVVDNTRSEQIHCGADQP